MPKNNKQYKELYVLMLGDYILTPDTFKEYWKNYGSSSGGGLYGWRPPKKVYYTLGQAKCGLHYVPAEIQHKVKIHKFASISVFNNL